MTSEFEAIAKELAQLDKFVPDQPTGFQQKQIELRLLLSIAESLDALLGAPVLEGR